MLLLGVNQALSLTFHVRGSLSPAQFYQGVSDFHSFSNKYMYTIFGSTVVSLCDHVAAVVRWQARFVTTGVIDLKLCTHVPLGQRL
jgi:hypothetical protein